MPSQQVRFEQWANFYVITAAAATLLGLLFVVITLAAARGRKDTSGITIYLTPAVIYFSTVLMMSALLTVPNQTRLTAVICICLAARFPRTPSQSLVACSYFERPKSALIW